MPPSPWMPARSSTPGSSPKLAERVAPLKNANISVLENVLHDADHVGGFKITCEHGADCFAALCWILGDLVVDSIFEV